MVAPALEQFKDIDANYCILDETSIDMRNNYKTHVLFLLIISCAIYLNAILMAFEVVLRRK